MIFRKLFLLGTLSHPPDARVAETICISLRPVTGSWENGTGWKCFRSWIENQDRQSDCGRDNPMPGTMRTPKQNLSFREKLGYGLGDMASNIVYQAVINVLMFFYTDVYGIEAAAAGTLMIAVRFFDALIDPMMGAVADRTRTKWGRYRPWMLWFAIPYGILAVAALITPNVSPGAKLVYAYISYALLMTAYTAVNIPYSALAGVMTSDKDERSGLQSWRFGMAMVGGFLVTVSVWPLSRLLGGGGKPQNLQLGFPFAVSLLAIIGVFALLVCFAGTRKRNYPDKKSKKNAQKSSILDDLKPMLSNRQWLIVTLAMFV